MQDGARNKEGEGKVVKGAVRLPNILVLTASVLGAAWRRCRRRGACRAARRAGWPVQRKLPFFSSCSALASTLNAVAQARVTLSLRSASTLNAVAQARVTLSLR